MSDRTNDDPMTSLDPDDLGFVSHRVFPDGAVAGVVRMLFGNYRVTLSRVDVRLGYEDGW